MSSSLTDYHAKYYAYELAQRYSAESLEKLASTFVSNSKYQDELILRGNCCPEIIN